jgi:hypothetical protein
MARDAYEHGDVKARKDIDRQGQRQALQQQQPKKE